MLDQPQEIFERIARHLFSLDTPSMIGESCAYRGSRGQKCAIGVLIPDEIYSAALEWHTLYELVTGAKEQEFNPEQNAWIIELSKRVDLEFLTHLQAAHDRLANWQNSDVMRYALYEIAALYDLYSGFLSDLAFSNR